MTNTFSDLTNSFLKKLGYNEKAQQKFSGSTRLFHDLEWYGDDAEGLIIILKDMGVDLSEFNFHDYFPAEYPSKFPIIYSLLPIPRKFFEDTEAFKPVTLSMIERSLTSGIWDKG